MDVTQYGERFERRVDPWGRDYYWATGDPPPPSAGRQTDLSELAQGHVTITPLQYDMTMRSALDAMQSWKFSVANHQSEECETPLDPDRPVLRSGRRRQTVRSQSPGPECEGENPGQNIASDKGAKQE